MLQQKRYIIETNIGRFREHLRSGLLDAGQTRTVTALLAEALEELDELDRRSAIPHRQAADLVVAARDSPRRSRRNTLRFSTLRNFRLVRAGPLQPANQKDQCSVATTSAWARSTSIRLIFCVGVSRPFSSVNGSTIACLRIRSVTDSRMFARDTARATAIES